MSDVTIKYKGQSIATMDASGTKTLGTQGKYCEGDIGVEYVKPAGPSGTKSIFITQNGTTTEDVTNYASAEITVNVPGPSGTKQVSISQNGTTTENVAAYASAQIAVNVPNSYAAADEGKVVSNGALVAQTSDTVTQNGTVDTTLINSLTVNVSGSGGSLPAIISKIDGGSFTPASDTPTGDYSITHTLGVVPSGIAVWATDMTAESYAVRTVNKLLMINASYVLEQVNTTSALRLAYGNTDSADLSASEFKLTLASNYYKSGTTYHWLAWA